MIDVTPDERILIEEFTGTYFSKDWNGLMLVVEHIELLPNKYSVWMQSKYCEIFYLHNNNQHESQKVIVAYWYGGPKIEAVYKTLIEFIKWYNSQTTKP